MAFAPSKRKRLKTRGEAKVSLNSMMDMMTIILLFLLKSFSASGQLLTPAQGINLPHSTSEEDLRQSMMVILMPNDGLMLNQEGRPFEELPRIATPADLAVEDQVIIDNLANMIMERQISNQNLNIPPMTDMTIQADEAVPYSWVLKVIQTATEAQITTFDFVIIKSS